MESEKVHGLEPNKNACNRLRRHTGNVVQGLLACQIHPRRLAVKFESLRLSAYTKPLMHDLRPNPTLGAHLRNLLEKLIDIEKERKVAQNLSGPCRAHCIVSELMAVDSVKAMASAMRAGLLHVWPTTETVHPVHGHWQTRRDQHDPAGTVNLGDKTCDWR